MDKQHAEQLVALLEALQNTGRIFWQKTVPFGCLQSKAKEMHGGWQILVMVNGRGMSIVCHDYSYSLETAEIAGAIDEWEFSTYDQVQGYREVGEVVADLIRVCDPPRQLN